MPNYVQCTPTELCNKTSIKGVANNLSSLDSTIAQLEGLVRVLHTTLGIPEETSLKGCEPKIDKRRTISEVMEGYGERLHDLSNTLSNLNARVEDELDGARLLEY